MPDGTGRRGKRLRVSSFALVVVALLSFVAAPVRAYAEDPTDQPTVDATPTTDAPVDPPPTTDPVIPPDDPTTQPPVDPTPPAPTTPAFIPVPGVKVAASDITLPVSYWDGSGNTGDLVIAVGDTGNIDEDVNGSFTLPAGVHATGLQVTKSCAVHGSTGFSCSLRPGGVGHVVVHVTVDNDAWRRLLTGGVSVSGAGASDVNTFSVLFPPGPPTPGIALTATKLTLGTEAGPKGDDGTLIVKLANTGATAAAGALEVQTPPGVDLMTFPALCKDHKRLDPDKDRCELGAIPAGKDVTLSFGLAVTPQARAQAPLTGAVHGFLTPSGQDTIEVLANYQITAPLAPGETALPTAEPSADQLRDSGAPVPTVEQVRAAGGGSGSSRQLSILTIVGGILLVIAIVGVMVFLSLRRRMQDAEPSDPVEMKVKIPEQAPEPVTPLPMRPIQTPRVTSLPRLPTGPVAGAAARSLLDDDED